ncbi:MAG: hypothetical protein ABSB78_04065 [Bacteroidota bacterium]
MASTAKEIYNDILARANRDGSGFGNWYVGTTSDPNRRLFEEHNVQEKDGWWIYREALSYPSARNVEQALLNAGFDGGIGGGDINTKYVYAYRKVLHVTNP